jgi:hypothetical protein
MYYQFNIINMNLVQILIVAGGSVVLGILGGFAARSIVAGILLAVLVFVGWFLWMLYKDQKPEESASNPNEQQEDSK